MRLFIEFWENIHIALGALVMHKMRAFLTLLGIIIGVLTIISISSVISGLNKAFSNEISGLGSDVLYVAKMPWLAGMDFFKYRNRKNITIQQAEELVKNITGAKAVTYTVRTQRNVKYASENLKNIRITGTTNQYEETANVFPEFGRFLIESDVKHRRFVCVLGWNVADKLFKNVNPLNKLVKIGGYYFRVIGILEKQGEMFGMQMDNVAIIPFGVFRKLFGSRRSLTIEIKVNDPTRLEEAKDEIRGIMRRARKLSPMEEDDFAINQQDMLTSIYKQLTTTLYIVTVGIGSISLLVGGIGIMNIMLVSVTERTREIGIRKALGARRADVLTQFLVEAVTICLVGGVIGILAGFGIGKIIDMTTPLPATVSLWSVLLGLFFTSGVGIFFGLYPAAKAARLNPIEALRSE
ncbi:MAG TPA: FtsX-like permease family protein [Bacteroidetes bacterium]|nr:FtsX-like permease family protein [Bacteroidota bacterium]